MVRERAGETTDPLNKFNESNINREESSIVAFSDKVEFLSIFKSCLLVSSMSLIGLENNLKVIELHLYFMVNIL